MLCDLVPVAQGALLDTGRTDLCFAHEVVMVRIAGQAPIGIEACAMATL